MLSVPCQKPVILKRFFGAKDLPRCRNGKRPFQALHHEPRPLLVRANHAALQSETLREILRGKKALQHDSGLTASPSTTCMVKVYRSF